MKLTRTLKISEDEFYDHLENDLLSTIYQCSQKELSANNIKKGLQYSKNEENTHGRIDITILDYQRGHLYMAQIKSFNDTITLSYETTNEEKGLKIVFHQDIESFLLKKHNKFMKAFSEGVYLGRMSDTLYDIQKKIVKRREEQST